MTRKTPVAVGKRTALPAGYAGIHGGILARRSDATHRAELEAQARSLGIADAVLRRQLVYGFFVPPPFKARRR